jgi:hypothetical protein
MRAKMDIDAFKWRLAETISWCADEVSLGDPINSLRSYHFRPQALTYDRSIAEKQTIVETLAKERVRQLHWDERWKSKQKYPTQPAESLAGGRLLIYLPDEELADGAAEAETNGFFNSHNEPPWDTWLFYIDNRAENKRDTQNDTWSPDDSYLISWVPPELIDLVNSGIWANPEYCIRWATEFDTLFTRQLRDAGLLV